MQLTHQITSTNRALDPPSGASSRLPPGTPFPGRAEALLLGQLFSICSPHHIGALVSLGLTDHDRSSFYRLFNTPRIDYEALTGCILQQTLAHTSEREGLHESLALEMGASLSGEGGATGGDGSSESSGSVPVVASTAREQREAGVHPRPLADRSVGSVFSRCSFREQQPLPACSGSAPRIRALLP